LKLDLEKDGESTVSKEGNEIHFVKLEGVLKKIEIDRN
jgi:hypothetical protein